MLTLVRCGVLAGVLGLVGCYGPPTEPKRECARTVVQPLAFVNARGDTTWTTATVIVRGDCARIGPR